MEQQIEKKLALLYFSAAGLVPLAFWTFSLLLLGAALLQCFVIVYQLWMPVYMSEDHLLQIKNTEAELFDFFVCSSLTNTIQSTKENIIVKLKQHTVDAYYHNRYGYIQMCYVFIT